MAKLGAGADPAADQDQGLAEINPSMSRQLRQRHDHLTPAPPLPTHTILLPQVRPFLSLAGTLQPSVNDPDEAIQGRAHHHFHEPPATRSSRHHPGRPSQRRSQTDKVSSEIFVNLLKRERIRRRKAERAKKLANTFSTSSSFPIISRVNTLET